MTAAPLADRAPALPQERRRHILGRISAHGSVTAAQLARELQVSKATVARDLRELSRVGALRRVYGGAVPCDLLTPWPARTPAGDPTARRWVEAVRPLVPAGATVAVLAGGLALALCRALVTAGHQVVTDSLRAAGDPRCCGQVTLLPGILHHGTSVVGRPAVAAARALRGHVVVADCRDLGPQGALMVADPFQGEVLDALAFGAATVLAVVCPEGPATPWPGLPGERLTALVDAEGAHTR